MSTPKEKIQEILVKCGDDTKKGDTAQITNGDLKQILNFILKFDSAVKDSIASGKFTTELDTVVKDSIANGKFTTELDTVVKDSVANGKFTTELVTVVKPSFDESISKLTNEIHEVKTTLPQKCGKLIVKNLKTFETNIKRETNSLSAKIQDFDTKVKDVDTKVQHFDTKVKDVDTKVLKDIKDINYLATQFMELQDNFKKAEPLLQEMEGLREVACKPNRIDSTADSYADCLKKVGELVAFMKLQKQSEDEPMLKQDNFAKQIIRKLRPPTVRSNTNDSDKTLTPMDRLRNTTSSKTSTSEKPKEGEKPKDDEEPFDAHWSDKQKEIYASLTF